MFRRLRYLWAFLAAAAAAVLLRGLAAALPCPATEVLSPINESPWELGKLVFWPYLTAALLLWRLEPLESASRGGHCAARRQERWRCTIFCCGGAYRVASCCGICWPSCWGLPICC